MNTSISITARLFLRTVVSLVTKRLSAPWRRVGVFLLLWVLGVPCLLCVGCGADDGATSGPDATIPGDAATGDGGQGADGALPDASPGPQVCAAGAEGLECLFESHAEVAASCDSAALQAFRESLEARHGWLPAWHEGEALFVTYNDPAAVAGEFNEWDPDAASTTQLCGSEIYTALVPVPSGRWPYKLVAYDVWVLDPLNWAFAYDEYQGNPDGRNSVLNTYDSGVGHLMSPEELVCSTDLDNCRPFTTYLPPGYGAPENAQKTYPVLFMHDGQNIYDDKDCCFGHTGWEINVTLDQEIAQGNLQEVVVVGFDHAGAARGDEYAYSVEDGGLQEIFMDFQVHTVQPTAETYWRLDPSRTYVAGSSFGGLISFRLALEYPDTYVGAASLSGAFWPGQDTGTAFRDRITATGYVSCALYMDHGGTEQDGGDGYADNIEVRDLLVDTGWEMSVSPDCSPSPTTLCYYHDVGATHDELAWRDRAWRFLSYFFAAP